jgi:Carboxypeptidase regulatory-like domain
MPKPWFTLGVLVTIFWVCLDASIQAQPREAKAEAAIISGLVTLKGEPARGVTVLLQEQQSNPANASRSKSDENGRFRFTGVAAGRYSISALAPGYFSPGSGDLAPGGQTLNVAEGEKIENISVEIRRGGVIAGRITDSQGRPVIEEIVNLHRLDKAGKPQDYRDYAFTYDMYRTDDRGAYRIFGVPEGRYMISVGREQNPGSVGISSNRIFYPRAYHTGVTYESEAKAVDVTEGSEVTDVDITLPEPKRTCEISGRVIDANTGGPVAGVEIVIGSLTPDGRPGGRWTGNETRSAENGEFRITGALPGRYALLVRTDAEFAPAVRSARTEIGAEGFISEPVILTVVDDLAGVEIKASKGATISGVVVIEGTNDPKILSKLSQVGLFASVINSSSNRQTFAGSSSGRVYSDGSFNIRGLQAGKAHIFSAGIPNTQGLVLARIEHNGATLRDGIEIEAGQQVTGVRAVLTYSQLKLRGELKIVGVDLPEGLRFRVSARSLDQSFQSIPSANVDARGQFVIENLLPGEYELRLTPIHTMSGERLDQNTFTMIFQFKEKVVVSGDNPQPVVITLDLSRKEGDR